MGMAAATNLHFVIDGMHCEACVRRVSEALASAGNGNVPSVSIGSAEIEAPRESATALIAAIGKAGYQARVQE